MKDIYQEIPLQINLAASKGIRSLCIFFLDDSFKFNHMKPIIDKLTKITGLSLSGEGSWLIRPHIHVEF